MKLWILAVVAAVLAPLVVYALVVGPLAPLWLLVPALVFATVVGGGVVARQWLPIIVIGLLRTIFVVLSLAVIGLGLVALASSVSAHWIVWAILAAALVALVVGITSIPSEMPPHGRPA